MKAERKSPTSSNRMAFDKAASYRRGMCAMLTHTAVSMDDPNAIQKLTDRVAILVQMQAFMKTANRCIKTGDRAAFLKTTFGTDQLWRLVHTTAYNNGTGFSSSQMASNTGTIRRNRQRIAALKEMAASSTTEKIVKGIRVVKNVKARRLQLIFRSKPSEEVARRLHRMHSFNWYVKDIAWHRLLNPQAEKEAEQFLKWYEPSQ